MDEFKKTEKIDAILTSEEKLIPSSGFAAAVMQRLQDEATAPPPIPFPWKRAIPAMIVALLVLATAAYQFVRAARTATFVPSQPHFGASSQLWLNTQQAEWLVAAAALAIASWWLARRLTASSSLL